MYWNNGYQDDLSGLAIPAFIIFVFTYCIATLFMEVFDVAVESIYLCYLVDESVHNEPKFASKELQKVVDDLPEQPPQKTHVVAGSEPTDAELQDMGQSTTDIATEV